MKDDIKVMDDIEALDDTTEVGAYKHIYIYIYGKEEILKLRTPKVEAHNKIGIKLENKKIENNKRYKSIKKTDAN